MPHCIYLLYSLICESFSDFPCFSWLTVLRILVRGIVEYPLICVCLIFSGVMGFGGKYHRDKFPFSLCHIRDTWYNCDLLLMMLTSIICLRMCLTGFSTVELIFSPFHPIPVFISCSPQDYVVVWISPSQTSGSLDVSSSGTSTENLQVIWGNKKQQNFKALSIAEAAAFHPRKLSSHYPTHWWQMCLQSLRAS